MIITENFTQPWATANRISDATDRGYLADELPLPADERDAVLYRQVQFPLQGFLE